MKNIIFTLFLLIFNNFNSQRKAEDAITEFESKYPQEKLHIEFNKSSYVAGENVWFKLYVFDGYSKSKLSTSINVELLDNNKRIISSKIFPIINAEAQGSFLLAEDLKQDIYYVRAYTSWMTNFSEDFQLIKQIPVFSKDSNQKIALDKSFPWSATAHPEGGSLFNEVPTKIAVRIHNNGNPITNWNAKVIDTNNPSTIITELKGFDSNIGLFNITPMTGAKYKVLINTEEGQQKEILLPEVNTFGIKLSVISNDNDIKYNISTKNEQSAKKGYKIIGTMGSRIVYLAKLNSIISDKHYSIPTKDLVNGVLQLTVFDQEENVVSKRLCFVSPNRLAISKPQINDNNQNLDARKLNNLSFNANANTEYYISVSKEKPENESNILSTFWLTGDLSSKINAPSQYFSKINSTDALDALLISEEWTRFNWAKVINGDNPIIKTNVYPNLAYEGTATRLDDGTLIKNTPLNIIFNDNNQKLNLVEVKTDDKGKFNLTNLYFDDNVDFKIRENETMLTKDKQSKKEPNIKIIFQNLNKRVPLFKPLPTSNYNFVEINNDIESKHSLNDAINNIENAKKFDEKYTLIKEITITAHKTNVSEKMNKELSTQRFQHIDEKVIDLVNDENNKSAENYTNIFKYLESRIAGLTFITINGEPVPNALTFLDEAPVSASYISSIHVSEIAMVKFLSRNSTLRITSSPSNVLAIYLKTPAQHQLSKNNINRQTDFQIKKMEGYNSMESFKNIDYSLADFSSIKNDTRTNLYWNPNYKSENTEAIVKFYNNDSNSKPNITIIGFDENENTIIYYNK